MRIKELLDAQLENEPFICALCGYCRQSEAACPEFKLLHWDIFSPRGKLAAVKALDKVQLKANEITIDSFLLTLSSAFFAIFRAKSKLVVQYALITGLIFLESVRVFESLIVFLFTFTT